MQKVIIGFSKKERCNAVRDIVLNDGFMDINCCITADEVLRCANLGEGGIVICGVKMGGTSYLELYEDLPDGYGMLVLLSGSQLSMIYDEEVFTLVLPVNKGDLLRTVHMILEVGQKRSVYSYSPRKAKNGASQEKQGRNDMDKLLIERAKLLLMNKYRMTESAAHRFIQKSSMDNGKRLEETARVILNDE